MRFASSQEMFDVLAKSKFRQRFKLKNKEREYVEKHGMEVIREHAVDFIKQRLGDAFPENDGQQTPMKNHPVFVAQHATATCCRGCIEKYHYIRIGKELNEVEINYIADAIMWWIKREIQD